MGKENKIWYYAVQRGKQPGVYLTWPECENQVKGFTSARYRKFPTLKEAWDFVKEGKSAVSGPLNSHTLDEENGTNVPENKPSSSNSSLPHIISKEELSILVKDLNLSEHKVELLRTRLQEWNLLTKDQSEVIEPPIKRFKADVNGTNGSIEAVHIYTDGACCSNGKNGAKAGIGVYWGPDHPLNVSERLPGRQTNNRAEIHAAAKALRQAQEIGAKNVILYTDSNFLIKGITEWIHGWKRNGWKLVTGEPVKNKEDFECLEEAMKGINVKWVHVRGHRGIRGNEEADTLAVQALGKPL